MTTRDERQALCIERWKEAKCQGSITAATGFGKTNVAMMAIQRMVKKWPSLSVLIVVPTDVLKVQWTEVLGRKNLIKNCNVQIVNTVIKNTYEVDLLIVDECHRLASDSFQEVFTCVKYKFILCLTATLSRLDEKEWIIKQYAPVCDEITLAECKRNGWVSKFTEYKVLIDVDLTEYVAINRTFTSHFAFFNFEFDTAMGCVSDRSKKLAYAKSLNCSVKEVSMNAAQFIRALKSRKEFVQNHPKKVEVAQMIIKAFSDRKIITFSQTAEMAESIGLGAVYHSKISKKKRGLIIEGFNKAESGVLNTVKAADEGLDVSGLSVAITLCGSSSQIQRLQRLGRTIRVESADKHAFAFHLVIANTMEEEWYRKASKSLPYISISDCELDSLLSGELEREEIKDEKSKHLFRF